MRVVKKQLLSDFVVSLEMVAQNDTSQGFHKRRIITSWSQFDPQDGMRYQNCVSRVLREAILFYSIVVLQLFFDQKDCGTHSQMV